MKSIILGVTALFASVTAISQPVFQKAYDVSLGTRKDESSQVEWVAKNQVVDILICYEDDKITVYSKEKQTYRLINPTYSNDDYTTWLMIDEKGLKCYASSGVHAETSLMYLKIEYVDVIILYLTKPN